MATITDNTYFANGSLYIPNNKDVSVQPVGSPTNQTELDFFIEKYERELLINALGVTLYDELQAQLPTPSLQKWIDLVDGKNYTNVSGNVKRWNGLKGYSKQSVIAFYVYCEFLRNDNETYSTVGTVKNNAKNAENFDATPKYIKSWNQFIEWYQGNLNSTYPTIVTNRSGSIGLDYYGSEKPEVSLYQYLIDSNELDETAFPDFEFRFYDSMKNSFGI